jgi:hypothetical protein
MSEIKILINIIVSIIKIRINKNKDRNKDKDKNKSRDQNRNRKKVINLLKVQIYNNILKRNQNNYIILSPISITIII